MKKINIIGKYVIEVEKASSLKSAFDIGREKGYRESEIKIPLYIITYDNLEDYKKRNLKEKHGEINFAIEQATFATKKETENALKKIITYVREHEENLSGLDKFCETLKGNLTEL